MEVKFKFEDVSVQDQTDITSAKRVRVREINPIGDVRILMVKGEKGDLGDAGNYEKLANIPQINGTPLIGNRSGAEFHLASDQDIAAIQEGMSSFQGSIENLESELNTKASNTALAETNSSLSETKSELSSAITSVSLVQRDVNQLTIRVPDIEGDVSSISARVSDAESNIELLQASVADAKTSIQSIAASQSGWIEETGTMNLDELPESETYGTFWLNANSSEFSGVKPTSSGQGLFFNLRQSDAYCRQVYVGVTGTGCYHRYYTYNSKTWSEWTSFSIQ